MFTALLLNIENGIATITLNRPEVYNAFNDKLSFELQDALKECEKNKSVRVVVITGAGKAFCSGQDLKAAAAAGNRSFKDSLEKRYNPIIRAIRNMPKPVIAKLNGVAAGAGCSLALACDMIIASEAASLVEVFINVGLVLDSGSSYFLPRLVGSSKAFELATMGTKVSAEEALQLGLVNKVVIAADLDSETQKIASLLFKCPDKGDRADKKIAQQILSQQPGNDA